MQHRLSQIAGISTKSNILVTKK